MGWDGGGQPLAQVILVFMRKLTHARLSFSISRTLEVLFPDRTWQVHGHWRCPWGIC